MDVKFRNIKLEDLEKVRTWRMKEEVSKYMYTDPDISADDQISWYKRVCNDDTKKYWLINIDGVDVGVVNLYDIDYTNKRASWAYYIGDENIRGKGIGKIMELNVLNYVFEAMGFNKLCCEVLKENSFVVGLHEKYGSKIEGIRRQHALKRGTYMDVVEMGILQSEWIEVKKNYNFDKGLFE